MSKDFTLYPEALELKQLGFDEPCFGVYFNPTQELLIGKKVNEYTKDVRTPAPTFSQAFRWFREKYGLGHMINGIGHESFIMNIGGMLHIFNGFEFKTYEEAELACLKKLIEIANEKHTNSKGIS